MLGFFLCPATRRFCNGKNLFDVMGIGGQKRASKVLGTIRNFLRTTRNRNSLIEIAMRMPGHGGHKAK
jgi:hypothetical protein